MQLTAPPPSTVKSYDRVHVGQHVESQYKFGYKNIWLVIG
jgi:hypothetical protein